MHTTHQALLYAHIGIGLLAIIAFWIPVATKKGSRLHVRAGQFYSWTMYGVVATAFTMCIMVLVDPIGVIAGTQFLEPDEAWRLQARARSFSSFLLMLSLLVLSALRHGLMSLQLKTDADILRRGSHRALIIALGVVSIIVGYFGVTQGQVLSMVFAVLGINGSIQMFRDTLRTSWTPGERIFAHLNGLLGTGIGAYTAVFAFGGSRLLSELLPGQLQVIPWVAPAIVGTIMISRMKERYVRKPTKGSRNNDKQTLSQAATT